MTTLPDSTVVLDSDRYFGPDQALGCVLPAPTAGRFAPTEGVEVDLHPQSGWPPSTKLGTCLHLGGLTACLYGRTPTTPSDQMAELDILFVRVTVPGHAGHELLEIGLAGNGIVARTVLYSLRTA